MDAETKKFLRNRKIGAMLPWFGVIGMMILTFSPIFGGFPLFFTELGFVANFYFFVDEYNWIAQKLLINKDHTVNHLNQKKVKTILVITIVISMIYTIFLSILRAQSLYNFTIGVSFLYVIYFSKHDIEYFLILLQTEINNDKYYLALTMCIVLNIVIALILFFVINPFHALLFLIILSILYVLQRDILKEMKKQGKNINWEDDDDHDRFSGRN